MRLMARSWASILLATLGSATGSIAASNAQIPSPQRIAILFGGNGDDVGFRNAFKQMTEAFSDKGWEVQIAAGQSVTNYIDPVTHRFRGGHALVQGVSKGERANLLDRLREALNTLKAGDQIYLGIITHGRPIGDEKSISHRIRSGLHDDAWMAIDDPEFTQLLGAINRKGIRIGFTDFSCFGGQSIEALQKFGCVVTRGSDDEAVLVGIDHGDQSGLTNDFAQTVKESDSDLSQTFLKMLLNKTDRNRPRMSGISLEELPNVESSGYRDLGMDTTKLFDERLCHFKSQLTAFIENLNKSTETVLNELYLSEVNSESGTLYKSVSEIQKNLLSLADQLSSTTRELESLQKQSKELGHTLSSAVYHFSQALPVEMKGLCKMIDEKSQSSGGLTNIRCIDPEKDIIEFKASAAFLPGDAPDSINDAIKEKIGPDDRTRIRDKWIDLQKKAWAKDFGDRAESFQKMPVLNEKLEFQIADVETKISTILGNSRDLTKVLRAIQYHRARASATNGSGPIKACVDFKF